MNGILHHLLESYGFTGVRRWQVRQGLGELGVRDVGQHKVVTCLDATGRALIDVHFKAILFNPYRFRFDVRDTMRSSDLTERPAQRGLTRFRFRTNNNDRWRMVKQRVPLEGLLDWRAPVTLRISNRRTLGMGPALDGDLDELYVHVRGLRANPDWLEVTLNDLPQWVEAVAEVTRSPFRGDELDTEEGWCVTLARAPGVRHGDDPVYWDGSFHRTHAASMLVAHASSRAADVLCDALTDEDRRVAFAALEGLVRLGNDRVVPRVLTLLGVYPSGEFQQALRSALSACGRSAEVRAFESVLEAEPRLEAVSASLRASFCSAVFALTQHADNELSVRAARALSALRAVDYYEELERVRAELVGPTSSQRERFDEALDALREHAQLPRSSSSQVPPDLPRPVSGEAADTRDLPRKPEE